MDNILVSIKIQEIRACLQEFHRVLVVLEDLHSRDQICQEFPEAHRELCSHTVPQADGIYFTFRLKSVLKTLTPQVPIVIRAYPYHAAPSYNGMLGDICELVKATSTPQRLVFCGDINPDICTHFKVAPAPILEFNNNSKDIYVLTSINPQALVLFWHGYLSGATCFAGPELLAELGRAYGTTDFIELLPDPHTVQKDSTTLTPTIMGAMVHNPFLAFYRPISPWQKELVSPKQREWIYKKCPNLIINGELSRGLAAEIIATHVYRRNHNLATPTQLLFLYKLGIEVDPIQCTLDIARVLIENPPITEKQRQYLLSLGIARDDIPTSRKEAKQLLQKLTSKCTP